MRVIYLPDPMMPHFKSFQCPLTLLTCLFDDARDGKLIQPWFDANRYTLTVHGLPNGLEADGNLVLIFKEGGGFEFASSFVQLRSRITHETLPHEEALPLYESFDAPGSSSSPNGPIVNDTIAQANIIQEPIAESESSEGMRHRVPTGPPPSY